MALGERFTNKRIENRAELLLGDYLRADPATTLPPVPVELVAEWLGLGILWEDIPDSDGKIVLAALRPTMRQVVFNPTHRDVFEGADFLYEVTLAHEIGHWDLHMERGRVVQSQALPGFGMQELTVLRSDRDEHDQDYWAERHAKYFAGCLLLPRKELCAAASEKPISGFEDVYRLRDLFHVTVSTLSIRLRELELCYIDSNGRLYRSRQEQAGQLSML